MYIDWSRLVASNSEPWGIKRLKSSASTSSHLLGHPSIKCCTRLRLPTHREKTSLLGGHRASGLYFATRTLHHA